jgi:hypothetical protein
LTVAGALTIQAQRISVDGPVRASAIAFTGSAWVTIEAGGQLAANQINVTSDVFVNSGQIRAVGLSGQQVNISARNILNAGAITADGSGKGDGGAVRIAFASSYIDTVAAVTSANGGATGHGGELTIDGISASCPGPHRLSLTTAGHRASLDWRRQAPELPGVLRAAGPGT